MEAEYIEFFNKLPVSAQINIKLLIPSKYEVLDTVTFSCVCIQHGVLKRSVTDNLKQAADRVVNNVLKASGNTKTVTQFEDIPLTDEFKWLIRNFNYVCMNFSDKLDTDTITSYVSYLLVSKKNLKSYKFFNDCLYQKGRDTLINSMYSAIEQKLDVHLDDVLVEYGEYIMTPLDLCDYKCYERDAEILDTVNSLCRMTKNNIILVGNPGVGKTSVVYGVCNYLQSLNCPECLHGYSVFSLNVNKIVSGTKYRGDMEKRMEDILSSLEKCNKTILFIDEIHTLFSRPSGDDSSSIQDILKPYLSKRSMVIGCTTNSEYKIIEKDKAFERRFHTIHISELSNTSTMKSLITMKQDYEDFHKVSISDDMCEYIVKMCDTYIKNRYFPDKAFDVVDGACVVCKNSGKEELTCEDVDRYVSVVSGIKLSGLSFGDLSKCKEEIKSCIFGQDKAVDTVFNYLQRYSVGVNDKKKPIASFLLVGPTGVGKTELCRQISDRLFTKESFIRIDMSEYMESHTVSKIIGSPPGYVGYNSSGTLLEKVKHNPFSVILFDEVEKAHVDVLNVLLQIMDDGRLTDAKGNTVNFCNCIIFMTSNIGCADVVNRTSIGFNSTNQDEDRIMSAVSKYFAPEFIGRIDSICVFNKLEEDTYRKIFDKELSAFMETYLSLCNVHISISDEAKDILLSSCNADKYGVRMIRKKIRDNLDSLCIQAVTDKASSAEIAIDEDKFVLREVLDDEKSC